jgi:hypothetical protein
MGAKAIKGSVTEAVFHNQRRKRNKATKGVTDDKVEKTVILP